MGSSPFRFSELPFGLRRLAQLLVAGVITLTACGGSGGSASTTPTPGAAKTPESQLVVAGPAGASGDAFQKLINAWGAQNNVKLTWITGTGASSFAKIQAQEQAGQMQIDMLNANDTVTAIGRSQGIWAPIDMSILTNKKDIDQSLAFPKDVMGSPPVGIRIFVIPSGIAYNADVFAKNGWPAPSTWLDLVNPTYGKCLVPLDPNQGVPWIPMLNFVTTGDWTNATKTFQMLKAVANGIQSWSNTNPSGLALVAKGTGCMTPTSQGRFIEASVNSPQLKYATLKEGPVLFGGTLNITKHAPHPIAAQMAVNLLMSEESGNQLLQTSYFPSTNTKVKAPTSGPAAQVPTTAQIKASGAKSVPIATYDHLDEWFRQYQAIASGS